MLKARQTGLILEEHRPDEGAPKWFVLAVALNVLEAMKDGGTEFEV